MRIDLNRIKLRGDNFEKRPSHVRRLFGVILAFLAIMAVTLFMAFITVKFLIGPTIKTVSALPGDFPIDLAFIQTDQAKMAIQNPESQKKILGILKIMPDWALNPILGYLSDDLKRQLLDNYGNEASVPKNFTLDDLKKSIKSIDAEKIKTISFSWDGINKSKEELAAFYKQKLAESGFEFKENLADYEINLGFWKDGIFGKMKLEDKPKYDGQTQADITVNYFNPYESTNTIQIYK